MLLAPIPWAGGVWALPFLTLLAPSEGCAQSQGRRHKRLTDQARQALLQTARWLPGRQVIAVADSSFSVIEVLRDVKAQLTVITRLRLDARLYKPPPPRQPGKRGRSPVKGKRLPTLAKRLADPATPWQRVTIRGWYGKAERRLGPSGNAQRYTTRSGTSSPAPRSGIIPAGGGPFAGGWCAMLKARNRRRRSCAPTPRPSP
jgi:hypothetical protein